jgi:hypothetical protein
VWLYQRDQQTNPFCPFHQRHKQVIAKPTSFVPFIARWSPQADRSRAGQAINILSWFVSTLIPFHYFPSPDTFFISSDTYARKTAPTMPFDIRSPTQTLTAKDQPTPVPERILQEFADLDRLMQGRDTSSEPYEFKASISAPQRCLTATQ